MIARHFLLVPVALAGLGTGVWNFAVAEYFGRIDPAQWELAHPAAPAPVSDPGDHRVELVSTRQIVPASGLPPQAVTLRANNNLDVVRHDNRVYMAWRTGTTHFAGSQVAINVVSSTDEVNWRFETRFATGADLREPRFLSHNGRLMLYMARLGSDPFAFEPQGMSLSERQDSGAWTKLESVGPKGFIVWRTRVVQGRALMVGYTGGENLYKFDGKPMQVHVLASQDGRTWQPAFGRDAVVLEGGGSETDFTITPNGKLFAVARNEAGDSDGYGSKLCTAEPGHFNAWKCRTDPKKYDSPLVFSHGGEVFLIGRRNVTESGHYDVSGGPRMVRVIRNELAYISSAKRCALWRWDEVQGRVAFVMDLPSRGDTCFASMIEGDEPDQVVVYDYSSDINGPDLPWAAGQRRDTFVYRHVLRFTKSQARTAKAERRSDLDAPKSFAAP